MGVYVVGGAVALGLLISVVTVVLTVSYIRKNPEKAHDPDDDDYDFYVGDD